ncbi:MAG: response regulator [Myxococcales bacterium]|jgi:diguanylate cyclase (GGDEF)-like protein
MSSLVLVAESDPFNLALLSELCSTLGYDVATAGDGEAVLDAAARQRPHLILMDAALPVMDGFQVLRILKSDQDLAAVPVVLVTTEDDEDARRRGLEMGAEDYVSKPYRTFEIQQRLRNVLRLQAATLGTPPTPNARETLDIMDPLTGAGTTSQLHISLEYEFTRAVRYQHPLSCVVVRCANYGQIAAALGGGDAQRVLVDLAGALRGCIRGVDHLFRSAPEEFTILLPETDARGCRIVVDRLGAQTGDQLFDAEVQPRPDIRVASVSYPTRRVVDGEALWREAAESLAR